MCHPNVPTTPSVTRTPSTKPVMNAGHFLLSIGHLDSPLPAHGTSAGDRRPTVLLKEFLRFLPGGTFLACLCLRLLGILPRARLRPPRLVALQLGDALRLPRLVVCVLELHTAERARHDQRQQ